MSTTLPEPGTIGRVINGKDGSDYGCDYRVVKVVNPQIVRDGTTGDRTREPSLKLEAVEHAQNGPHHPETEGQTHPVSQTIVPASWFHPAK
jgi:hypothetical protein